METQLIRRFKVKVLFKYWIIVSDLFPILSRAHCFSVIQNPAVWGGNHYLFQDSYAVFELDNVARVKNGCVCF